MTYQVVERFYTWQGEGCHLGRAAFFIRLYGCPLHCPWCDSAGTWHKDYVPDTIYRMTARELADEAEASTAPFVVLTGGEPAMYDFSDLYSELSRRHIALHLETSGAFELRAPVDWLTVSPKWARLPHESNLLRADEIKVIVEEPSSIEAWWEQLGSIMQYREERDDLPTIWLHPEWSRRADTAVLSAITEAVKRYPRRYRAGYQLHKLYAADLLDERSAKERVPLGGDLARGY